MGRGAIIEERLRQFYQKQEVLVGAPINASMMISRTMVSISLVSSLFRFLAGRSNLVFVFSPLEMISNVVMSGAMLTLEILVCVTSP